MCTRSSLRKALLIVGMTTVALPSFVYSQSQDTGGVDSSYHSGSAATGHYGNSGSAEASRIERQNSTNTLPAVNDQEVNQRIRQALREDEGLLPYAEGIDIGIDGGRVTLRGPVKTEKDKADISAAVRSVAGVREIDNQLQVAPNLGGTTGSSANSR
jgi:hyperosmotically inducible periplasmic protein